MIAVSRGRLVLLYMHNNNNLKLKLLKKQSMYSYKNNCYHYVIILYTLFVHLDIHIVFQVLTFN